jgi:hypothetical protein
LIDYFTVIDRLTFVDRFATIDQFFIIDRFTRVMQLLKQDAAEGEEEELKGALLTFAWKIAQVEATIWP